mmetsp:Transcript_27195/g.51779  ORF Transcript_27195/g.51779 Transcript_27195/m.51779 type:complete len:293 (+) Transcript_27195:440-1318(+)
MSASSAGPGNAAPSDDASLVVVILDTSPLGWAQRGNDEGALTLRKCAEHVGAFVNALMLLNNRSQVALMAMHADGCHFLYETPKGDSSANGGDGTVRSAGSVGEQIVRRLQKLLASNSFASVAQRPPPFSGALSQALCYAQRRRAGLHPRILCLAAAPDCAAQYIAVMNALFAAQRTGVVIDGCPVTGRDSAYLQQAAHLTKGIYFKPPRLDGLLQYLLAVFAVDTFSRKFLEIPRSTGVDFRASCFCHKRSIDVGYVCSVCLSIFCQTGDVCTTCGAEFSKQGSRMKKICQ